jgi:hypothetical protein
MAGTSLLGVAGPAGLKRINAATLSRGPCIVTPEGSVSIRSATIQTVAVSVRRGRGEGVLSACGSDPPDR